jgi:hypothetical protein
VSVTPGNTSSGDLLIKGDIFDAKLPEGGFKLSFAGDPKVKLNIRYSIISIKDNKVLGTIQAASDSGGKSSFAGFSNTDTGYAFGRSCDELVKYIKKNL